jgi:deoxyribodipyrimidine photolyase-related protein
MRKKHDILMQNDQPIGDKWNFDKLNRRSIGKSIELKDFVLPARNVSNIIEMLKNAGIETIGSIDPLNFQWPVTRSDSLMVLEYFLKNNLHHFGTYQDAMDTRSPFLFHSLLSFSLNTKMISPKEVVDRSIAHWYDNSDKISIAQIEGFVRQILGWREYMRGIYWTYMPEYRKMNFFKHTNKLPVFYWSGDTRMNCLKSAIKQSLNLAYAHHIQRLMLTGNFALLVGVDPDEVDQWYLGIYIDAIEWVEITNTRGMSQYADGGIVASKPYVSSANYINKMSNYCRDCYYDRNKRHGKTACPFNSLYWNFFLQHHGLLANNMRTKMAYVNLNKMTSQERLNIKKQASKYLYQIDQL